MGETLKWSYIPYGLWIVSLLMEVGAIGILNIDTMISHRINIMYSLGDPNNM